jgi:cell division protein FtsW (lipid II flippase)
MQGLSSSQIRLFERTLLVLASIFVALNALQLVLIFPQSATQLLLIVGCWNVVAIMGYVSMSRIIPTHDPFLFPLALWLCGWGLLEIQRLFPEFAMRQVVWLILSLGVMLFCACVPQIVNILRRYRYTLLFGGLALLAITFVIGTNPSGSQFAPALWLDFGSIYVQPSEPLKIILVAFLASYLSEQLPAMRVLQQTNGGSSPRKYALMLSPRLFAPIVFMWALCVLVLIWQRDLGTAVLFFMVFVLMLYISSGLTSIVIAGVLLIVAAGAAAYFAFDVVQLRVDIWLNPWVDAKNRAYQIVQSLIAVAEGGVIGQGVGQGYPGYIPVAHSDFIFAAIAEEWGLIGVVALIAFIATFAVRGLMLGLNARGRTFSALLAIGLSLMIALQALLIMLGVLKIIPLTGVTLPFISYGGSSLLTCFAMLGLLLNLSAQPHNPLQMIGAQPRDA